MLVTQLNKKRTERIALKIGGETVHIYRHDRDSNKLIFDAKRSVTIDVEFFDRNVLKWIDRKNEEAEGRHDSPTITM